MAYCLPNIYDAVKTTFYKKHGDFKEHCSLDGSTQRKTVTFEDGAVWYEVSRPECIVLDTVLPLPDGRHVRHSTETNLFTTEFWSSDDAKSRKICDLLVPSPSKNWER